MPLVALQLTPGATRDIGRDTGQEGYESFFELKTINLAPGMDAMFEEE